MEERMVDVDVNPDETRAEFSLRPKKLVEFIGQDRVKEALDISIRAALTRGEALDHAILCGPPGLGKTTLSLIIANEMGTNLKITSGPAIERAGDLAAILTNIGPGEVLFIDEIHRLNRAVEEILYPAMEDFALDIVIGKGPSARSIRIDLPRFTLIGATTRQGMLSGPLRDRFGMVYRLEYYDPAELETIVMKSAELMGVPITQEGASEIARRSRGTPRIANRLLRRVRDYSEVKGSGEVDRNIAGEALLLMEVDERGLDRLDHRILDTIIGKYTGGPVGIDTISAALNEERETLEDVYEPYLIQIGFLDRTPRGRVATRAAFEHMGRKYPEEVQQEGQDRLI